MKPLKHSLFRDTPHSFIPNIDLIELTAYFRWAGPMQVWCKVFFSVKPFYFA